MEYSANLIQNPNAEANLTHWTASGVTIVTDSTKCFALSPGGMLSQASGYVAFTLQPAEFVAKISFKYMSIVPKDVVSIRAFYAISLKYLVESEEEEDTFVVPLDTEEQDATGWFSNTITCGTRSNAVLVGYDVTIYSDSTSPVIRIDDISLVSALDGLAVHELNPNPHQLPLAITVGPFGIKATKGAQVMFWLKDNGDAVYAGEISAAQITVGQLTNEQIDVAGLNLLSNTTFASYASDVSELNSKVASHTTAIQQNATEIGLQASSISTLNSNYASLSITANGLVSSVSSLTTNYNALSGDVADNSSEISQMAGEISSKVSATDFTGNTIASKINQTATTIKLSASKIDLTGLTTIYSPSNSSTYTRMGGTYADLVMVSNGAEVFEILDTIGGVAMSLMGREMLTHHSALATTYAVGKWDFGSATITGLGASATLKFA